MHHAAYSTTPKALLNKKLPCSVARYWISGLPLSESEVPIESAILRAIQRNNSGLLLYRTTGFFRSEEDCTIEKRAVYRLKSLARHAVFEFFLSEGNTLCDVLMLFVEPEFQGNFFALKDFLLRRVAATLFDAGIVAIIGAAMFNTKPVRKKPHTWLDWRREKTKHPNLCGFMSGWGLFGTARILIC